MKKVFFLLVSVVVLSGCEMTGKDWARVSDSLSSSEYGDNSCEFENSYLSLGCSDDVCAEVETVCNSTFFTFNNTSYDTDFQCDYQLGYHKDSIVVYANSNREEKFNAVEGNRTVKFGCDVYNSPEKLHPEHSNVKIKVVNGFSYASLKNNQNYDIECTFSNEYEVIKSGVIIYAGEWSEYIRYDSALNSKCNMHY